MDDDPNKISLPRKRILYIPIIAALGYCLWGWFTGELVLPGIQDDDAITIAVQSIPYLCLAMVFLLIAQIVNVEDSIPIKGTVRKPVNYAINIIALSLFFAAVTGRV